MSRRTYTADMADTILDQLAEGVSLKRICEPPGMPTPGTVRGWAVDDVEGFGARFSRANAIGVYALAAEVLEISDDGRSDTFVDDYGVRRTDHEVVARSKLRVESRRWLLSRLLPREFGERQQVEHTGSAGSTIFVVSGVARTPGERLEAPTIDGE